MNGNYIRKTRRDQDFKKRTTLNQKYFVRNVFRSLIQFCDALTFLQMVSLQNRVKWHCGLIPFPCKFRQNPQNPQNPQRSNDVPLQIWISKSVHFNILVHLLTLILFNQNGIGIRQFDVDFQLRHVSNLPRKRIKNDITTLC